METVTRQHNIQPENLGNTGQYLEYANLKHERTHFERLGTTTVELRWWLVVALASSKVAEVIRKIHL